MLYTVSGRAPSFLTAGLAIIIAIGMHASAGHRGHSKVHTVSATESGPPKHAQS